MQLSVCFLSGLFTFFVCLLFKFIIFNHERSEGFKNFEFKMQKITTKNIMS